MTTQTHTKTQSGPDLGVASFAKRMASAVGAVLCGISLSQCTTVLEDEDPVQSVTRTTTSESVTTPRPLEPTYRESSQTTSTTTSGPLGGSFRESTRTTTIKE